MALIASDSFGGTAGNNLNTDSDWGNLQGNWLYNNAGGVRPSGGSTCLYQWLTNNVPSGNVYAVSADVVNYTNASLSGPAIRIDTTNFYCFFTRYNNGSNTYQLYKTTSGGTSLVAESTTKTFNTGTTKKVTLVNKESLVEVWADNTLMCSATDSDLVSNNRVGMRAANGSANNAGQHLDNWEFIEWALISGSVTYSKAQLSGTSTPVNRIVGSITGANARASGLIKTVVGILGSITTRLSQIAGSISLGSGTPVDGSHTLTVLPEWRTFTLFGQSLINLIVSQEPRIMTITTIDITPNELNKSPNAKLLYTFDWTNWLSSDQTISTTSITISPSGTLQQPSSNPNPVIQAGNKKVNVWLEAGTLGTTYRVSNTINFTGTGGSGTETRTVEINVVTR